MKKARIAMVGAGNIANTHLDSYMKMENVEIVALCDINEQRLHETADKYGIEKLYTSETEMLAKETLDAVDVCVWNCNHAKCSIEALDAGLHVLCEKPMAYSVKEAEEMIEAAKRNNKLLMIGFVLRFDGPSLVAKDFIDKDYLGEIYYSKATYLRRHGSPGGWFSDKSRSGGGPVIDLGVHVIDLTRFLMGSPKPVSVFASTSDRIKDRKYLKNSVGWIPKDAKPDDIFDVEDFGVALIKYEGDKTTLLETSYSLNGESSGKKELFGTKGGIKMENDMKIYTVVNDFLADITPDMTNLKDTKGCFDAEMEHFVDCILNGTPCRATAEDGLVVMKILEAIYESARTGREVQL